MIRAINISIDQNGMIDIPIDVRFDIDYNRQSCLTNDTSQQRIIRRTLHIVVFHTMPGKIILDSSADADIQCLSIFRPHAVGQLIDNPFDGIAIDIVLVQDWKRSFQRKKAIDKGLKIRTIAI